MVHEVSTDCRAYVDALSNAVFAFRTEFKEGLDIGLDRGQTLRCAKKRVERLIS